MMLDCVFSSSLREGILVLMVFLMGSMMVSGFRVSFV